MKEVSKKYNNKLYNFILIVLLALLFVSGYTYILQRMYSESILENTVEENSARTDAMYKSIEKFLNEDDFSKINTKEDMDTDLYKNLQARLNEYRTMNSTRYFYTAKKNSDGKLVYLVDGLDLSAQDFAYPGTYIEKEMIPYIHKALSGKVVYSQEIVDTTWGHIFTACYPIHESDASSKVIGALCIEMDMEPTYQFIEQRNHIAIVAAILGAGVVFIIITCACLYLQNEHKQREQREILLQKAADAALSADRAKSTFLFNMSHDIRTPMNAILGYVNLAKKNIQNPAKLEQYIDYIQVCSDKLLSLLNNVLDLARIETDKVMIEQTALIIEDVFNSCILLFQSNIDEKKQHLKIHTDILYPYVYADEIHVSEILMNIMSNAIKYTGTEGTITCKMYQEKVDEQNCNTYFSIQDTGIGMSKEYQNTIFDVFSRERNTTQSGIEGSGLGMSIVKKLVDLMDGKIWIDSKLGCGSTFTICIPCKIASENEVLPKRLSQTILNNNWQGKHILLVEDNDLNADIAQELLKEEKIFVTRVSNGVECVDEIEKQKEDTYDLILMDIQMPIMNGYDAALKIRRLSNPRKANIPIIAMTANAFAEDKDKALRVGMNDHVSKPIDMNVLLTTIQKYL